MESKKTTYEELQELCKSIGYRVKMNSTTTPLLQTYLRNSYNIDVEVNRNTWAVEDRFYGKFNVKVLRDLKHVYSEAGFIKWQDAFNHGLKVALTITNNKIKITKRK